MTENNKRPDGRGPKEFRELKIEVGILDRAEGSARVNLGKNMAIATIYGPREMHPKHSSLPDRAVVRINYRMATFSVDDYKRSFPSRREKEISKVLSEAFESVIFTSNWPRSVIDIHSQLFTSDGGTRTTAAIAITAALADAGIPMRDLPGSIASGIYEENVVLDLTGHEDMKGTGDMPLMYSPSLDEISLFQLDGKFTFEQFKEAFTMSTEAISEISKRIKEALVKKYVRIRDEYGIDDDEIEEAEQVLLDDSDVIKSDIELREDKTPISVPISENLITDNEPVTEEIVTNTHEVGSVDDVQHPEVVTSVKDISFSELSQPLETGETQMEEAPDYSESSSAIKKALEEDEMAPTHNWFTTSGAKLKPMGNEDEMQEEEEESENENKEDEETENIMRDLEYSMEGDE